MVLFQFHYGSVKSLKPFPRKIAVRDFNSTMVRLKGITISWIAFMISYFNSTMVRLKVGRNHQKVGLYPDFNSTMVRLKGNAVVCYRVDR